MKMPRTQIARMLSSLTQTIHADADSTQAKSLSREIAAYLLEEGRTGELDSLMRDVVADRAEAGLVEVTAVSAHELTSTIRHDIELQARRQYPDARKFSINERIDTSQVGGLRLELVNKQLDLTVRDSLNRFKELTTAERTA